MDSKTTENFMDKNFNFINLLLFAGLYIACFVYLLQDTVTSITPKLSDAIGMFAGEAILFMFLLVLASYEEATITKTIIWFIIVLSSLLQMSSGAIIMSKFKEIQDSNGNINSLDLNFAEEFKNLLTGDVKNALLCLLFIPVPVLLICKYTQLINDVPETLINIFVAVAIMSIFILICIGIIDKEQIFGESMQYEYFKKYKSLLITSVVLTVVAVFLNSLNYDKYSMAALIILITVIIFLSLIMLFISIVVLKSDYNVNKNVNINSGPNKLSPKTIPALIFLCVFQIFFTFFVSFIISKKFSSGLNLLLKLSWGSVFVTTIFQIISLFIVIISYKYFDDNFISKTGDLVFPNSEFIIRELKDYNNLFVGVTAIIIVFMAILLKGHDGLNSKTSVIFEPYFYSGFIIFLGVASLSMSSEMIKISNDILTFKNTTPIPKPKPEPAQNPVPSPKASK